MDQQADHADGGGEAEKKHPPRYRKSEEPQDEPCQPAHERGQDRRSREQPGERNRIGQRRHRIEHADEVWDRRSSPPLAAGTVACVETYRERVALVEQFELARRGFSPHPRTRVLVDSLDRFRRDLLHARGVAAQRRAVLHLRGNATAADHRRQAADRVGAAAEAEQEDPVPGTPQLNQGGVAIDDVAGQPEPERLAHQIVDAPPQIA
jgi:hypothetical protein